MSRVFVDTNVLFPFSVMDLMLALTEDGLHEVIWSQALLAEWERVIVRSHRRSAASAAAITAAIREYFADSEIAEEQYSPLVADMPGDDPDDRVHMAAALAGRAEAIVTWNQADFPREPLAELGLAVCDPDTYLTGLFDEFGEDVATVVVRLAAEKQRPPRTLGEYLDLLDKAGVPTFAARLRDHCGIPRIAGNTGHVE